MRDLASADDSGNLPSPTYYPWFDFLRILLAIGVFFSHAAMGYLERVRLVNLGDAFVQIFFALSGFLIGKILLKSSLRSLPRFYFNRVTRIWVPYAIALALVFIVTAGRQTLRDAKLWETFLYMGTFTLNIFAHPELYRIRMPLGGGAGHLWSICVEEQFYLLAPLVIVLLPRSRVALLLGLWLLNFWVVGDFATISLGVLLAILESRFGEIEKKPLWQAAFLAVLAFSLTSCFLGWLSYESASPMGSASLVALLARRGKRSSVGVFLGGVSYPFYLNHWIGLHLLRRLEAKLPIGASGAAALAVTVVFALCSLHYWLVDRVVLRRRSGWYSHKRGLVATLSSVGLVSVGLLSGLYFSLHPIH